jgi:non-specific serine/threonine protein kinase
LESTSTAPPGSLRWATADKILVSQSTRELVRADRLRDLGVHRLKDLSAPERIYQLGEGNFPPLKSLNQSNLPVQPTGLVGRECELQDVRNLLRENRLVTLTGAGGSGKTRLAFQVAADTVDEYRNGVWFVPFAAVRDPRLIEPTIGQVLGSRDELNAFLRDKKLLLLLDNLEQLLPDGASVVASLDADVLATSRERLNVIGEQEYPVPTLPLDDGVALFVQRARQFKPRFEPDAYVPQIARRLDGLPLAIELAAARAKVLTTNQILERLGKSLDLLTSGARDAPERHRTLRATIEWSYDLLNFHERRMFALLAVFPGSFDLDAAQVVCGAELDTLQSLLDKSLLRDTEDGRFFMLATVREFAVDQLEGEAAQDIRRRHTTYFRAFVDEDGAEPWSVERFERLARERDNVRSVLAATEAEHDIESLLRLAAGLWRFWNIRGPWQEARRWLDSALSMSASHPSTLRAQVLEGASDIAFRQGRYDDGRALLGESLAFWLERGDARGAASSRHARANLEAAAGNLEVARELWTEAQSVWRELGETERFAFTVFDLGLISLAEGEAGNAVAQFEESLAFARREGLDLLAALSLQNLGFALLRTGRLQEGSDRLREALKTQSTRVGYQEAIVICLIGLAEAAQLAGDGHRGATLIGAAEALRDEIGFAFQDDLRRDHERLEAAFISTLGAGNFAAFRERGRELGLDGAVVFALAEID